MVPLTATTDLRPIVQWAATVALLAAREVHLTLVQERYPLDLPQVLLDQQELPTHGLPQTSRSYKTLSMLWRSGECKEIQDTAKHVLFTSLLWPNKVKVEIVQREALLLVLILLGALLVLVALGIPQVGTDPQATSKTHSCFNCALR